MEHSKDMATFMKIMIMTGCAIIIYIGAGIVLKWSERQTITTSPTTRDSSYTQSKVVDTAKKAVETTIEKIVNKTVTSSEGTTAGSTLQDGMIKKGYDLIFLGIAILFLLFAMPWLAEFNFLQLFTAKFRDKVEASKAIINDAANAVNTNIPIKKPEIQSKAVSEKQRESFKEISINENAKIEAIAAYAADPQKGKWGGLSLVNERKLSADILPLPGNPELFKVQLKVISTNPAKPLTNKVTFHLHPTFPNENPVIYVVQGEAKLELIAWGAFTVGAEADIGATKLELDMSDLPEAPLLFKSR